jgi:hypothetical protein
MVATLLPSFANCRSASELPKWLKSKTLRDDPNRATPMTETEELVREKLRNARELPRWTKSKTDKANKEPKRAKPRTETALESLAKFRKLNPLPR